MKASVLERRERFILCPQCGDDDSHRITALKPGPASPRSFCKSCGLGIVIRVGRGGKVFIEELPERRKPAYVLLRLVPQEKPVYLIVRDAVFEEAPGCVESAEDAFHDSHEFLYNHQLCPRIFIGKAVAFLREGDEDSYGLFEYVATHQKQCSIDRKEGEGEEEDVVLKIFSQPLGLASQGGEGETDSDPPVLLDSAEKVIG